MTTSRSTSRKKKASEGGHVVAPVRMEVQQQQPYQSIQATFTPAISAPINIPTRNDITAKRRLKHGGGLDGSMTKTTTMMDHDDVMSVDMEKMANILGTSLVDLLQTLRRESVGESEGLVLDPRRREEEVTFRVLNSRKIGVTAPAIKHALVTAWSEPSDWLQIGKGQALPREMMKLGGAHGMTVINTVLYNMAKAGLERVVVVVGGRAAPILKDHIQASFVTDRITVDFVELPEDYEGFHAQTILACKDAMGSEPFVLATMDRVFSPATMYALAQRSTLRALSGKEDEEERQGDDHGEMVGKPKKSRGKRREVREDEEVLMMAEKQGGELEWEEEGEEDEGEDEEEGPHYLGQGLLTTLGRKHSSFILRQVAREEQRQRAKECVGVVLIDSNWAGKYGNVLMEKSPHDAVITCVRQVCPGGGPKTCGIGVDCPPDLESGEAGAWGLEMGLFAFSSRIFDILEELDKELEYYTLALTLNIAALSGKLRYSELNDQDCIVFRREGDEVAATLHQAGEEATKLTSPLVPWKTHTVTSKYNPSPNQSQMTMFLGPAATDSEVIATREEKKRFFVVPVAAEEGEGGERRAKKKTGGKATPTSSLSSTSVPRGEGLAITLTEGERSHETKSGETAPGAMLIRMPVDSVGERSSSPPSPDLGKPPLARKRSYMLAVADEGEGREGGGGGSGGSISRRIPSKRLIKRTSSMHDPETVLGEGLAMLQEAFQLPSDIEHVTFAAGPSASEPQKIDVTLVVDRQVPLIAWVLMILSLASAGAEGPIADLTTAAMYPIVINGTTVSLWRCLGSLFIMTVPFVYALWTRPKAIMSQIVRLDLLFDSCMVAVGSTGWGITFYSSLDYTSIGKATLLGCSTPVLLVIWKLICRERIGFWEASGIALAVIGSVFVTLDNSTNQVDMAVLNSSSNVMGRDFWRDVWGMFLATVSAAAAGLFYLFAKKLRPRIDPILFLWSQRLLTVVMTCVVLVLMGTVTVKELFTEESGLFGWTISREVIRLQILQSFLTDAFPNAATFLALKYFEALVVSVLSLSQPVFAVVEGMMVGMEGSPGPAMIIGSIVVLTGAGIVSVVTSLPRQETFNASSALKFDNDKVKMEVEVLDMEFAGTCSSKQGGRSGGGGGGGDGNNCLVASDFLVTEDDWDDDDSDGKINNESGGSGSGKLTTDSCHSFGEEGPLLGSKIGGYNSIST